MSDTNAHTEMLTLAEMKIAMLEKQLNEEKSITYQMNEEIAMLRTQLAEAKRLECLLPKKLNHRTLDDYTEDELRELGKEQECYYELESLCCKYAINVTCEMSEFSGRANYIASVSDMADALIEAKQNAKESADMKAALAEVKK